MFCHQEVDTIGSFSDTAIIATKEKILFGGFTRLCSRPYLIRPPNNWASHVIGPNSSTYFKAELSGAHVK